MLTTLALFLLAQAESLPRSLAQEEPLPRPESTSAAAKETPIVDLDWLELTPAIGFSVYSANYRANPAPAFQLAARAPLPWLSPAGDPKGEYFGVFAEAAFMTIDRDLSSSVDHRRGLASFYSLGMDYSVIRDTTWILIARGGLLYAYYGDIADLSSGLGFMVGASAGVQLSAKTGISYSPELLFGKSGSLVFLNTLGLSIQF
jgi:hypothetical protein